MEAKLKAVFAHSELNFSEAKFNKEHLYLGQYTLIKPLVNREDNFKVYSGFNKRQERVVVKLVGTLSSFHQAMNEAVLLCRELSECPSVPRLVDVGFDAETQYFVFVLTPLGFDLEQKIELLNDLMSTEAPAYRRCFLQVIGPQAVAALEEIHKRGIIHRDIKPSNLIYVRDTLLFIDFGAATTDPKAEQIYLSRKYASDQVRAGNPGTMADDWIALAYTWYALWVDEYKAETRPSLAELAKLFPFFASKLQAAGA